MSDPYVRAVASSPDHVKILRLKRLLGDIGFEVAFRLWAYASQNQKDGDFSDYSDPELSTVFRASVNKARRWWRALKAVKLVDKGGKIHDWQEHNGYFVTGKNLSDVRRQAARARWDKEKQPEPMNGAGNIQALTKRKFALAELIEIHPARKLGKAGVAAVVWSDYVRLKNELEETRRQIAGLPPMPKDTAPGSPAFPKPPQPASKMTPEQWQTFSAKCLAEAGLVRTPGGTLQAIDRVTPKNSPLFEHGN